MQEKMVGNGRVVLILYSFLGLQLFAAEESHGPWQNKTLKYSPFVFRDFQEVTRTEAGEIRSVRVRIQGEEKGFENLGHMELSFITLDPQSMLLPMFLDGDFLFYVHTGEARLGWMRNNRLVEKDLSVGDIYRIPVGSVFHVFNTGKAERLRLIGILDRTSERRTGHMMEHDQSQIFFFGGDYSVLSGFDEEILRTAFKVSKEEMRELLSRQNSGPIVHVTERHRISSARVMRKSYTMRTKNALQGILGWNNKNRRDPFNILKKKPSFSNKYGWTVTVDWKDYPPLKHSDIGVFMVNMTKGSMLIPHWNPRASEIGVVTQGVGIVQVVYPNSSRVESLRVSKGDVFMVPRFYPMVQLALGNESFEVLGFSTYGGDNQPQFLAGINSVFNVLDLESVALGFGVSSDYLADFMATQKGVVIVSCHSCAQEVEEKIEREAEEEERRKKEEEEERRKKEEEEEERRKKEKEEEEERKKEKEEEEERKKEEEEEEREKRREEEEEERKRREEEEEEEERKRREEEKEKEREEEEREREEERREEEGQRERKEREKEEEEERKRREEEKEKEREERERKKREEEEQREREEEEREREEERREKEGQREREEEERERKKREEEEREREEERREKEGQREREEEERERKKREEEERERKEEERERREEGQREREKRERKKREEEEKGEERERREEEDIREREEEERERGGGVMISRSST